MYNRRAFILGAAATLAAPALVRATSLMPVKALLLDPIGRHLYVGRWGDEALQFATIAEALAAAGPADTIWVNEHYEELHKTVRVADNQSLHISRSHFTARGQFDTPDLLQHYSTGMLTIRDTHFDTRQVTGLDTCISIFAYDSVPPNDPLR